MKTETNTLATERDVRAAAVELLGLNSRDLQTDFEHGQWWVTHRPSGAQWSAEDAEGLGTAYGFTFEQVTEGKP